ncbi:MAG: AlpA family phage regulatory protein [bacterium]|nr:AlpA family phage regulatory protein [bacterium]
MRKILREPEVSRITGRSRVSRWRDERAGKFPKRVHIGPNAIGWFEDEIQEWLETRPRGLNTDKPDA